MTDDEWWNRSDQTFEFVLKVHLCYTLRVKKGMAKHATNDFDPSTTMTLVFQLWWMQLNHHGSNKIILWRCWMMSKEEEVRLKLIRISCCRLVSAVVNGHRLGFGYLRFCSTILRFDTKIELTVRKGYSNNKYDHYYILYLFSWATQ